MDLVEQVYRLTQAFPKQEMYGLTSQMQRAAVSIPSNIAEGHTRRYSKEYLYHVSIAQASLSELETQIEIAMRLKYLSQEQLSQILKQAALLGRQLYALQSALINKINPRSLTPGP